MTISLALVGRAADRMKLRQLIHSGAATVALALLGLLTGAVAYVLGWRSAVDLTWAVTTVIAVPSVATALLQRLRHGSLGVDLIALLALAARSPITSTWRER